MVETLVGEGASTPEITQKFVEAYERNGGLSVLGNPTTEVHYAFGFEVQDFPEMPATAGGVIMYNPNNSTAYFIHGAIWDKYYAYADKARLGAVASDEKDAIASPKGTVGRYTEFENGSIHWISNKEGENVGHLQRGKSFVTYGDLNKRYDEIGGTGSDLGFPIKDQETKADGHDCCEFEGGSIYWDGSTESYRVKTGTATPLSGKIAFASSRDQNQEIYVINTDGNGIPIRLTNYPDADDGDPSWSPDGKQIAFSSNRSGNWKTYVMNADDGSEPVCLLEDVFDAWGPAWSPDGKKIAVACKMKSSDDFEIYTLDIQSGVLTQVTDNSYEDCHPSWSPDSNKIAFISDRDGNQEIYIADILAGTQTKLTDEPANDDYPEWSPDGSMILFMSNRDGNFEIYKIDIASKEVTRLTYSNSIDKHAQWSPDGQNIVFISDRYGGDMDIYIMKSDGTGIDRLVDWEGDETHPTWSPDHPYSRQTIQGHVYYHELAYLLHLKYAKIELDVDQNPNNGVLASSNIASDGSYKMEFDDVTGTEPLYVRVYADSEGSEKDKVSVSSVDGDIVSYSTSIQKISDENKIEIPLEDSVPFQIYGHMFIAYDYYAQYLELDKISVILDNSLTRGEYNSDKIRINPTHYSTTYDNIELYHEYCHFVMDTPHKVLTNIPPLIYNCINSNFNVLVDEAPNSEYPWIEGWAIFSSAVVNGDKTILLNGSSIDLENAKSMPNNLPVPFYAPKSSKNAIRNAAFLWDMYDGKGGSDLTETFDQFDGQNDITLILDILDDEREYWTKYDDETKDYCPTYIHKTPLNIVEFYDEWTSSGKPQENELKELIKHHYKEYKDIIVYSPVNLHLYDSDGNHIGVNKTTGEIEKEIVGSYYSGPESHPEEVFIICVDENKQVSCVIEGEEEGTFTLEFENAKNGKVVNTTYENVPVKKGSLGYLETNIEDEQHFIKMDYDGDGTIDESIAPTHVEIDESDVSSPSSITNLQSTSDSLWINWKWINPKDSDFNHTEIYLNGIFQTNTSGEYFNATGLEPETSYTIGTRTADIYGNVNETWVNLTATTKKAPIIVEAGMDQKVEEGTIVNFEGSFTASGSHTYSYRWDFGDGSSQSDSLTASHTYADNGVYTVNLTVTDEQGNFGNDTLLVTVNNAIPVVNAGSDLEVTAGDPVSFAGNFSDLGWLDTHTSEWNFGEGTVKAGSVSEENGYPNSTGTVSGSFSYFDAGEYTVTLNVADDDGGIGQDQLTVTVRPIKAEVTFDPETFNLNSNGEWVTAYIELPAGYSGSGIDITSVLLNGTVHAVSDPKYGFVINESEYLTDLDLDGVSERMFKFNRGEVAGILKAGDQVTVTFTGKVEYNNGISSGMASFEGSDVIKVTQKDSKNDKTK